MIFDMKTLMMLYILINIISIGSVLIIWNQNHNRFRGLTYWLIDMIFQTIGILLIVLRGIVPDFMSIIVSNFLILAGDAILVTGLEIFVGRKITRLFKYLLISASLICLIYFTVIQPDITNREILISSVVMILAFQGCWILWRNLSSEFTKITQITRIVLSGYIVVSAARIVHLLIFPLLSGDFFKSGAFDSVAIIMYIFLTSCLTISLILMVIQRLLQTVQAQEEKFTLAFHSSPYAILLTRLSDGVIFEVNDGFVNIMGYSYAEAIGKTTTQLHIWETEESRAEMVSALLEKQQVQGLEFQFRKKSGEMLSGLFSASIILVANEKCIMSSISDITEIARMKKKLQEAASHDDLTGLPNRMLFYDQFESAATNAIRYHKNFAVLSLDIDYFKTINDRLGHAVGDMVLIETAKALTGSLWQTDTVARFGGDEFVILLWEMESREDVQQVTRKILERFRQPMTIGKDSLTLTLSIGAAMYPADGENINDLIQKSDEAMYFVKENGRDNYHFANRQ